MILYTRVVHAYKLAKHLSTYNLMHSFTFICLVLQNIQCRYINFYTMFKQCDIAYILIHISCYMCIANISQMLYVKIYTFKNYYSSSSSSSSSVVYNVVLSVIHFLYKRFINNITLYQLNYKTSCNISFLVCLNY